MTPETRQLSTEEIALHCGADFQQLVDNSKAAAIRALTKRECIAFGLSPNKTWALFVAILQCQSSGKPAERFGLITRANLKKIRSHARNIRTQYEATPQQDDWADVQADVGEFEMTALIERDKTAADMIEAAGLIYPKGCPNCTCFARTMSILPSP